MKPLYGSYDIAVDDKNRLGIPAEVRRALDPAVDGEALYLVTGINAKLWLWPEKTYDALAQNRRTELVPDEADLDFDQMSYSLATKVEWDKQGRIVVPDKYLKKAGLKKDVTLAAVRDHLEIWDRAQWIAREEELERRRAEIAARNKQQRDAMV